MQNSFESQNREQRTGQFLRIYKISVFFLIVLFGTSLVKPARVFGAQCVLQEKDSGLVVISEEGPFNSDGCISRCRRAATGRNQSVSGDSILVCNYDGQNVGEIVLSPEILSGITPQCCLEKRAGISRYNRFTRLDSTIRKYVVDSGDVVQCRVASVGECASGINYKSNPGDFDGSFRDTDEYPLVATIEIGVDCNQNTACQEVLGKQSGKNDSVRSWSCTYTDSASPVDGNPGQVETREYCLDLRDGKYGVKDSILAAEKRCYDLCSANQNPERYTNCLFTTVGECDSDGKSLKFESSEVQARELYEEGLNNLAKEVGTVKRLGVRTVPELISKMVKVTLGFTGSIALVFFIYSGILWMISAGNSDRQSRAQKSLVWTSLGILAILGSYILTDFIIQALLNK